VPPTRTHFGARWIRSTLHLGPDREEEHHTGAEAEQPGECYHGGASKGTLHAFGARLLSNGSRLSCGRNAHGRKAVHRQIKRLASESTQFFPTSERPAASSAC
jgi:hypothetical protein